MCAGGGCEPGVTARTKCGWIMLAQCGELLCEKRLKLKLKRAVLRVIISPMIFYKAEKYHAYEKMIC